jgi:hypothetical protein
MHHPDGRDMCRVRAEAAWNELYDKIRALEQRPLNLLVQIPVLAADNETPSSRVRPSFVQAAMQRKLVQHALEQARARGELGGANAQAPYVLPAYAKYLADKAKRSDARLAKRVMLAEWTDARGNVNQTEFSILDAKQRAEEGARAYLDAKIRRLTSIIAMTGQSPALLTLTLPPSWHATPRRSANSAQFGGQTITDAVELLRGLWRGAYQALSRRQAIASVRVVEPHSDGTPHLHAVMGDRDAKALVGHILQHYPFEDGQWAVQIVALRSGEGGLPTRAKRNPAYRTLPAWLQGTPVAAGVVGAAAQIMIGEAELTKTMVQYLVGYVIQGTAGNRPPAELDRLADALMDRGSKPKSMITQYWKRGFDLALRASAWTGIGGNAEQWIAAAHMQQKGGNPELADALRNLLHAWATDATRSWQEHADAFGLRFQKDREVGFVVSDCTGRFACLRESRPVVLPCVRGTPACLRPLADLPVAPAARGVGAELRQLALNKDVRMAGSSPRQQGPQKQGARVLKLPPRKPYPSAPDTTPELDLHDLEKIAIDGTPYKVVAAPGVGKTALYVAMLQAFAGDMEPVLLLYRTRSAARDTYTRMKDAGVDVAMALGGRGVALDKACKVTVATVDKLLHGKLSGWRGRVWIDEAQDLTQVQVHQLQRLEQQKQIDIVCVMGDARQCLMPDTTPQVFQQGWSHPSMSLPRWFVRTLSVSLRCPSAIAQAATVAAPQYGPIHGARQGGAVWSEECATRDEAVVSAALAAASAHEAGCSVVVQCDTHESCARVREQLRLTFGPALPAGLDVRTPAQAKGGTWARAIYLLDHDIDGRHMCARPAETLATALTRATDAASTIYYTQAA